MKIISGVDSPMTGDKLVSNFTKIINATNDVIFYESIPFEMLRTYETAPQIKVNIGDYPAVCKNLNCNFHYVVPVGEVHNFTYDTRSRQLVLMGDALPANASEVRHVEFAHSKCTVSALTNETLTCTLDHEPVCGDHMPKLYATYGLVNNSANMTNTTITCTISSVTPTSQLNLLGGDNLTISGTNFPIVLSTSTVDIKFDDR